MFFRDFSIYLQKIEAVSARLSITAILADLFKDLSVGQQDPDEIVLATYLMQGSLVPSYLSLEFQMSEKMLIKTLARVQGKDNNFKSNNSDNLFAEVDQNLFEDHSVLEKKLSVEYKKIGDIGELFEKVLTEFSSDKTLSEQLSITQVHQFLSELATTSGLGSQDKKSSFCSVHQSYYFKQNASWFFDYDSDRFTFFRQK